MGGCVVGWVDGWVGALWVGKVCEWVGGCVVGWVGGLWVG